MLMPQITPIASELDPRQDAEQNSEGTDAA
jgi:hypothetical protein